MRIDFCIWGCGQRGKNVYRFMQGNGVRAFIDMNPKLQGETYQEIPIISFETYLERYRNCVVIITPLFETEEIEQRLRQHNVAYFSLKKLPQEITQDGIPNLLEIAGDRVHESGTVYLYGLNLFSACLMDYFTERKPDKVKIVPEAGADSGLVSILNTCYPNSIASFAESDGCRLYLTSEKYDIGGLPPDRLVNLYDFMDDVAQYHNPQIRKLKNTCRGKRCFIIGTGPSLRMEDLDKLAQAHELCIGVNGIIRAFPSTVWRPDYYLCQWAYGFNEWRGRLLSDCRIRHMLVSDACLGDTSDPEFMKFHVSALDVREDCPPLFSRDFSHGAYLGGNVMYTCIQFAYYLGYSEMYLYGVDHTVTANKKYNHFSRDYLVDEKRDVHLVPAVVAMERKKTDIALAHAKKVGEALGFKVYNASRKTMLDAFDLVDFDTLF